MTADEVAQIVDRLDAAGIWYCIEGGWGVDALLEKQTRRHDDVDLAIGFEDVDRICAALAEFARDDSECRPAWSFVIRAGAWSIVTR